MPSGPVFRALADTITETKLVASFDAADAAAISDAVDTLEAILDRLRPVWVHLTIAERRGLINQIAPLSRIHELGRRIPEDF